MICSSISAFHYGEKAAVTTVLCPVEFPCVVTLLRSVLDAETELVGNQFLNTVSLLPVFQDHLLAVTRRLQRSLFRISQNL